MTGVITDRMSPESKTNNSHGPPSTVMFAEELATDSDSEVGINERSSHDAADCIVFFINETSLGQSPQIEIMIDNKILIRAIIDSGSEVNLISEEVYESIMKAGIHLQVLPVENVVLLTAFGKRSKRIRQQAFVEFAMGDDLFECIFLISSQLKNEAIIGCQFLRDYGININFCRGSIGYVRGDVQKEHAFLSEAGIRNSRSDDLGQAREIFLQNNPPAGQQPHNPSADCGNPIASRAAHSCSVPTAHQTVRVGRKGSLKSGKSNCVVSPERTIMKSKGRVTLDYGAECDQLSSVGSLPDTGISEEIDVESQGSIDSLPRQVDFFHLFLLLNHCL